MSQVNRCLVCNAETPYPLDYCSQECEDDYNTTMEELSDELGEYDIDEHAEDERLRRENNLK